jgi:hypothetical protein
VPPGTVAAAQLRVNRSKFATVRDARKGCEAGLHRPSYFGLSPVTLLQREGLSRRRFVLGVSHGRNVAMSDFCLRGPEMALGEVDGLGTAWRLWSGDAHLYRHTSVTPIPLKRCAGVPMVRDSTHIERLYDRRNPQSGVGKLEIDPMSGSRMQGRFSWYAVFPFSAVLFVSALDNYNGRRDSGTLRRHERHGLCRRLSRRLHSSEKALGQLCGIGDALYRSCGMDRGY